MYHIAVVTSTRADYGLLRPVLLKLAGAPEVQLQLLVTGTHLSKEYGYTADEIKKDEPLGIRIAAKLDFLSTKCPGGRLGTALRVQEALDLFTYHFSKASPHALLVLGDRYEIFAAAQGAALLNIPVVHISGGDVTTGADDDWFRHCITKMAKLHFPSCEEYRRRVIRMGEQPSAVFNVGGLGDENIRNMRLLSAEELSQSLNGLAVPDVLVTFHPETAAALPAEEQAAALLAAAGRFSHLQFLFTAANADAGGEVINRMAETFCRTSPNAHMVSSLGVLRYLSAMKYAKLVLGNSSSGVVETPSFGTPAVNIGHRQDGRLMPQNILCCDTEENAIAEAMQKALQPGFLTKARQAKSPYNGGDTSGKILRILLEFLQNGRLLTPKIFYDGE